MKTAVISRAPKASLLGLTVAVVLLLSSTAFAYDPLGNEDLLDTHQAMMMIVHQKTQKIVYANQAARNFYGYPRLTGMSLMEISAQSSRNMAGDISFFTDGVHDDIIVDQKLVDGGVRKVEIKAYAFEYLGDDHLFLVMNDKTPLFEAEERNQRLYGVIVALLLGILVLVTLSFLKSTRLMKLIRQKNTRLENIIEATRSGTWEWHCETGDLAVNDIWARMLGYEPEELAPVTMETFRKLVHPEDIRKIDYTATRENDTFDVIFRMRHRGGRWVWIHSHGKVTAWTPRMTPGLIIGTHTDISRKMALEHENRMKEHRFETIASVSNIGIWEYTLKDKTLWCSREYFQMLGFSQEEVFVEGPDNATAIWRRLVHPEDFSGAVRFLEAYMDEKSDRVYENRFRMVQAGGDCRWILSRARLLRDEEGRPTDHLVGIHIDITQIKRHEERLEYISYHDHLTHLFNRRYFFEYLKSIDQPGHLPIGLTMIDLNGLKLINDAFGNLSGDEVLKLVAHSLGLVAGEYGLLARIGGDEFMIVTLGLGEEQIDRMRRRILKTVSRLYYENVSLTVALGYALKTREDQELAEVFKKAEQEMFKRKILDERSVVNHSIRGILETLTEKYTEEKLHSERVSHLCALMGAVLGLEQDDIQELELAGLVHDIGKISIPDEILDKPGKLTEEEFDILRQHTRTGYQILRAADEFTDLAIYALSHHERYDGRGYPKGLKGEEISYFARIIAIADAYEAMTADRSYRRAMSPSAAIEELRRYSGTQFDPSLVDLFIDAVIPLEQESEVPGSDLT